MAVPKIGIDVVDKIIPSNNHQNIPIINRPNPCYGCQVTAYQLKHLIQLPRYYLYEAGTKTPIDGYNISDYFPEGGGGGGGVTPQQVQSMIDSSLEPVDERLDKIEEELSEIQDLKEILEYKKNEEYVSGRVVYITPGQLYQVTHTFTSNNDPSLTLDESLQADITAGNLEPVTDSEVSDIETRVSSIEDWQSGVNADIADLKVAVVEAEEMSYFSSIDDFPAEGKPNITYVDKSTGKTYMWNGEDYELMDTNNIIDGSIFNSIL